VLECHLLDGGGILEVTFDEFNVISVSHEPPRFPARPDDCRNLVSSSEQVRNEVGSDEASGASDECPTHAFRAIS
jgi:hypothetical protein